MSSWWRPIDIGPWWSPTEAQPLGIRWPWLAKREGFLLLPGDGLILVSGDGRLVFVHSRARLLLGPASKKCCGEQLLMHQRILENVRDAVIVTTAEPIGSPGPVIVYANAAAKRQTGYGITELLGRSRKGVQMGFWWQLDGALRPASGSKSSSGERDLEAIGRSTAADSYDAKQSTLLPHGGRSNASNR